MGNLVDQFCFQSWHAHIAFRSSSNFFPTEYNLSQDGLFIR